MTPPSPVRIGTAGWSLPRMQADAFPAEGGSLERYAGRFDCAEINSSFHRSHRSETWDRWARSVPDDFLFSAKLSKEVTHRRKLIDCAEPLAASIAEMRRLGDRLGVVLVQLPPSLAFDREVAGRFFDLLRGHWTGAVACEPRHPSWFTSEAECLLTEREVARVAADPAKAEGAGEPGGWRGLAYFRLHGSPVVYRSSYDDGRLEAYAQSLGTRASAAPVWCIFDNTASSAAIADALKLQRLVAG
ncbi:MAG: hypothetical protein QOE79_1047 [Sphingomonadales bacterium]|jgi:uncharacterized protein YecE (DUF72 family)|nr:hypothetical protein [Sphingomonadales bacterium]